MAPSPGGFLLSILVPKCSSITSTSSKSKFHLNTFQYSVGGAVMPNAIIYGQDCIWQGF